MRWVVVSVALAVSGVAQPGAANPVQAGVPHRVRVSFLLAPGLTDAHVLAVQRQVDEIWRPYGVELSWDRGETADPDPPQDWVHVLVQPNAPHDPDPLPATFHLGSLHRRTTAPRGAPAAMIYTTMARLRTLAWRAVNSPYRVPYGNPPAALLESLLARVIAHELGHFLLASNGHADVGLMRANYDGRDALGRADGRYALTARERRALAAAIATRTGTLVARR
jgi:hypothetical protein